MQKILHDFHDLVLSHFFAMTHSERHADGGRVVSLIDVDFQVQIQRNWGGKEQKRKAREKGRDLTKSYDKSTYTDMTKLKKQRDSTKNATKNFG